MFVFSKTPSLRRLGLPHQNSMKIMYPPLLSSNEQKKKQKKLIPFFHSGGQKTNLNGLFGMLTLGQICCSFAFVLVSTRANTERLLPFFHS